MAIQVSSPPVEILKMRRDTPSLPIIAIMATNNAIRQTRRQRCRIQWTSAQSRLLRRPPRPRSLHRYVFALDIVHTRPHAIGGQVISIHRLDTIVVFVRGCYYGGHGNFCYLVLLGHISSSKAGFVQCVERREQFHRSVFFLWPPTEMTSFS